MEVREGDPIQYLSPMKYALKATADINAKMSPNKPEAKSFDGDSKVELVVMFEPGCGVWVGEGEDEKSAKLTRTTPKRLRITARNRQMSDFSLRNSSPPKKVKTAEVL